jgi:predicted dehydrogenase
MAVTAAEAEQMISACKKANRKLMIAYRIQHEPNNTQVKNWVRSSEYGKVKLIESFNTQNTGDPAQWRLKKAMGGGALADVGIYCLNTIRFLTGEEPEWVMASQYNTPGDERFKEVDESVLFQMGFPGGVQVNCGCSFAVHESRRYRCYTDKGAWFGMDPAFSYNGIKIELSQAKDNIEFRSNPFLGEKNQFALEMDHFAKCIMEDKQPYTPGEEGLQDMRIIEAIFESARTGKKVMLQKYSGKDLFRGAAPKAE